MLHGIGLGNALAALANDHGQLGFVVNGGRHFGHLDGFACGNDALRHFGKDDGLGGNFATGFGTAVEATARKFFGVCVVVFAHAKNIAAGVRQWRTQLHIFQGNGRALCWQGFTARQGIHQSEGTQFTIGQRQIKGRDGV